MCLAAADDHRTGPDHAFSVADLVRLSSVSIVFKVLEGRNGQKVLRAQFRNFLLHPVPITVHRAGVALTGCSETPALRIAADEGQLVTIMLDHYRFAPLLEICLLHRSMANHADRINLR